MKYKHIFFDLDGTLTDSAPGIMNSFRYSLNHYGKQISDDELRQVIGPPLTYSFEHFFGFQGEEINEVVSIYREYFSEKGMFENTVYDGIIPLLERLKGQGKKIYVATSKPEKFTHIILEHFNMKEMFDGICGSTMDKERNEKKDIIHYLLEEHSIEQKNQVLMVGDRSYDCLGARENGIDCLGVLYGYGTRDELTSAGAKFIAETPEEIEHYCTLK